MLIGDFPEYSVCNNGAKPETDRPSAIWRGIDKIKIGAGSKRPDGRTPAVLAQLQDEVCMLITY